MYCELIDEGRVPTLRILRAVAACTALSLALSLPCVPAFALAVDWVTVGDPGNACDTRFGGCAGSLSNVYRISKYEVTNNQYTQFLNSVAKSDPGQLYNTDMIGGLYGYPGGGGITRIGSSGSYIYGTIAGYENKPVTYVSFYDALRFTNWLYNGEPVGAQGSGTTEDGAYSITEAGIASNSITRNAGAWIFLPSADEWYKSAYHSPLSQSYFIYATGSDAPPSCTAPGATPNTANCSSNDITTVGSYTGSPSPHGTYDQLGNVFEWNETIGDYVTQTGVLSGRGMFGGDFQGGAFPAPSLQVFPPPHDEEPFLGFRVAALPEPATGMLVVMGMVGVAWLRLRLRV